MNSIVNMSYQEAEKKNRYVAEVRALRMQEDIKRKKKRKD